MRVLFIFHTPWLKGGASKSGLTLIRGLRSRGVAVMAICPAEDELSARLRSEGFEVRVVSYDWAYPHFKPSPAAWLKILPRIAKTRIVNAKALPRLEEIAAEFRPDIIHTNSGVADIGVKLARRLGVPHVSHFREFGWKDCGAIMLHEKAMGRYARQYGIAIGKEILKFHAKGARETALIYNGIIESPSLTLNPEKDSYFLYVGGLYREKGIEVLLDAYSRLGGEMRKAHPLKIAGSAVAPAYRQHLLSLASRLGIAESVEWLGERGDAARLMAGALALVVPSEHEAFGRIVVEAMANACLVIGRDSEGIKEQFDNGLAAAGAEIGLRFRTAEQLGRLMAEVAANGSGAYIHMRRSAEKTVAELYSVEAYADKVLAFYNKILNE